MIDIHNDCYKVIESLSEDDKRFLTDTVNSHTGDYNSTLLTQQIDGRFGQTKITDYAHRMVKDLNGIKVY